MSKRLFFRIRISDFDKFNKREGPLTWLRLDVNMARSSAYLSLSASAKLLWVWLLSEAAKSALRECYVNPRDVSREIHCRADGVPLVLQELLSLQWIQVLEDPYERTIRTERTAIQEKLEPESKPVIPSVPAAAAPVRPTNVKSEFVHPGVAMIQRMNRHPDADKFQEWVAKMELKSPELEREASRVMFAFGNFEKFLNWGADRFPDGLRQKITEDKGAKGLTDALRTAILFESGLRRRKEG